MTGGPGGFGGGGGVEEDTFTVTGNADDAALVPFASVSVAVNVCTPFEALFSVKLQLPDVSTLVVPRLTVPLTVRSYTVTVLLASAVPFKVIVLVVSTPLVAGENVAMIGAAGGAGGGGEPLPSTG